MDHPREEFVDDGEELLAEIHETRRRISERFGNDPFKLVAYYMELQKQDPGKLVRAPEGEPRDDAA